MSTEPSSLMRAVQDEAGAAAIAGVETTAEQLDLLRDPQSGRLPSNVFQLVREQEAKRGRGRPAGARNRKSDQLAKIIVQKYGDPVEGMAALYAMPLDQLVEMLLVADGSRERQDHLDTLVARTDELFDRMSTGDALKLSQEQGERNRVAALELQTQLDAVTAEHEKLKAATNDVVLDLPALSESQQQEIERNVASAMAFAVGVKARAGGNHVFLIVGETADKRYYKALGGNQGNRVSIIDILKADTDAIRWPAGVSMTAGVLPVMKPGTIGASEE